MYSMQMRRIFGRLFLVGSVLLLLGVPAIANADSIASQQITVTASVAPELYVVVNQQNVVKLIVSNNSSDNVPASVFRSSITSGNQIAATSAITAQYKDILAKQTMHPGVLYKYQPPAAPQPPHQNPLTLVSKMQLELRYL
jgi:hypothetical protein